MPFTAECFFCHLVIQNVPDRHRGLSKQCPRCQNLLTLAEISRARPASIVQREVAPVGPDRAVVAHPIRSKPSADLPRVSRPPDLPHVASSVDVIAAETPRPAPNSSRSNRRSGRVGSRIGLVAFCFASLAFMIMAIPEGVWFATALALMALLCGCASLASSSPKSLRDAAAYPALAVGLGVLICLAYSHRQAFSHGSKPGRGSEAVAGQALVHLRTEGVSRQIEPKDVEWVDASTDAFQSGNIRVRVASAGLEAVGPTNLPTRPARPEKRLVVRLRVSNAGASQIEHYRGWNGFLSDPAYPGLRLRDDQGYVLRPKSDLPANLSKMIKNAEIPPEKWVDDLLVFEIPPSRTSALRLELPGAAIGSKDKLLFRIPNAMIQHLADGPAGKSKGK